MRHLLRDLHRQAARNPPRDRRNQRDRARLALRVERGTHAHGTNHRLPRSRHARGLNQRLPRSGRVTIRADRRDREGPPLQRAGQLLDSLHPQASQLMDLLCRILKLQNTELDQKRVMANQNNTLMVLFVVDYPA